MKFNIPNRVKRASGVAFYKVLISQAVTFLFIEKQQKINSRPEAVTNFKDWIKSVEVGSNSNQVSKCSVDQIRYRQSSNIRMGSDGIIWIGEIRIKISIFSYREGVISFLFELTLWKTYLKFQVIKKLSESKSKWD